jgi:hypothetical protein
MLFALSTVPLVLMNITQKLILNDCPQFNINLMLLGESIFQFFTIVICFWFDLIPYIGTSSDLKEFGEHLTSGTTCFFQPIFGFEGVGIYCSYSLFIGLLFAVSYYGVYYYNSHIIQQLSPSVNAFVQTISIPIQLLIWFGLAPMMQWACGKHEEWIQVIFSILSLPFFMYGSWIFYDQLPETNAAGYSTIAEPVEEKDNTVTFYEFF